MALIQIKCTNCGSALDVDDETKTIICPHCGAKFINENKVENHVENNTTNIKDQTNIYYGKNTEFDETKQISVLKICLESYDFANARIKALELLNNNPKNDYAKMIYACNFTSYNYDNNILISFDEHSLYTYLTENCDKLSDNQLEYFLKLVMKKTNYSQDIIKVYKLIFQGIIKKRSGKSLYENLQFFVNESCTMNTNILLQLQKSVGQNTLFESMNKTNTDIAVFLYDYIQKSDQLTDNEKSILSKMLNSNYDVKIANIERSKKIGKIVGIIIGIGFIILLIFAAILDPTTTGK